MFGTLWNKQELEAVKTDKWLATQLMNEITLTSDMASAYPYEQRRKYLCDWVDEPEPIIIYATDEKMLKRFIDLIYRTRPDYIKQVITQYRPINPHS